MNLKELFDYKNQLMKDICSNENIVKLITNNPSPTVPNHKLAYSQVYPFQYIPETAEEGKTFVCFDVDIKFVENKTFYDPIVYVWVFTHKSLLRTKDGSGVRIDALARELDQELNGSQYYGLGSLELFSCTRFCPVRDYLGRVLIYSARDLNRQGKKRIPANRQVRPH